MALSAGSKRMIACPFEECSGGQWCPHAVQVALATDRVGTPGRWSRDCVAKRNQCLGGSSEGGGGLINAAWWQWDATAPRQGGEEADRWYVLKHKRCQNLMGLFILYSVLSTRKLMYDAGWDQPGLLGTRWSPNPLCWSYHG